MELTNLLEIEGIKLSPIMKDLTFVGDILYYEGALLSHYKNNKNLNVILKWTDVDLNYNRWLVSIITDSDLNDYIYKQITLLDLTNKSINNKVYFVDIDNDQNECNTLECDLINIPEDYLSSKNSMLSDFDKEYYFKNRKIIELPRVILNLSLSDFQTTMANSELMELCDDLAEEFTRNMYSLRDVDALHEPSEDDPDCDVLKEEYRGDYDYFYDYFYDKLKDFCTNKLLKLKDE